MVRGVFEDVDAAVGIDGRSNPNETFKHRSLFIGQRSFFFREVAGSERPMSRVEKDQGILPSILDRLIDPETAGAGNLLGYNVHQMIDAVRRDLEDLLNTRQSHQGMPAEFKELLDSVATYGLPDFTSIDSKQSGQRKAIGKIIEGIINKFEPRLRDVVAIPFDDPTDVHSQRVSLHITARLSLDPSPEVGFDTVVELMSGHTSVRPRED